MSRKIYAWVKSETCTGRDAVLPGSRIGRNEELVSRHGDWNPWLNGKLETLEIIAQTGTAANSYHRACARLVADLLDWA
jgi:hypothetical protein